MDYFILGMGAAVASFVGGIISTNTHWSDVLTDVSFIILYVLLASCATQVLWNCLQWSTKNPASLIAASVMLPAIVMAMAAFHENQLVYRLYNNLSPFGASLKRYFIALSDSLKPVNLLKVFKGETV